MLIDRRRFVSALSGSALLASGCRQRGPVSQEAAKTSEDQGFDKPLGAQLYTLRDVISRNPADILRRLARIGYTEVEALQSSFARMRPFIERAELKTVSMHLVSSVVTEMWGEREQPEHTTVPEAAEWASEAGVEYLVMPGLPGEERGDLEVYRELAGKLNQAGEACREAGLTFAYHNHSFEFEPMGDSSPLETLLAETDPELVKIELDVFWVSVAGLNPVTILKALGDRVALVHLKDKAADAPEGYEGGLEPEHFEEVGDGSLDFVEILRACEDAGVQHYFVEQDHTPGDPLRSLQQSYRYLRSLEV